VTGETTPLVALRDALDDAIRSAYCGGSFGEGWYSPVTKEPTPADILEDPSHMRLLTRIQAAAWKVVKERVEDGQAR
jgi:hypothetical protein